MDACGRGVVCAPSCAWRVRVGDAGICSIMLLFLAFTGYSELKDEKLMSMVVFIIIAFVEMIGSVFVVMVWQPQKVYSRNLARKDCFLY